MNAGAHPARRTADAPQAGRSRITGRPGFRHATSSNPAASNIDRAPNHIESSLRGPGLSTG